MDSVGARWGAFACFATALDAVADEHFRHATRNFRDLYHHRSPVNIIMGISQTIVRELEGDKVSYSIGGVPPLSLAEVITAVRGQLEPCYAAFEAFQHLIWEQEAAIIALIEA
jgi:hypothetical protein